MQNETNETDSTKLYHSETALDWFRRVQISSRGEHANDSTVAAWSFARGNTGISFVDEAIKVSQHPTKNSISENQAAFLEITGNRESRSLVLTSLAAHFVVTTRSSKFRSAPSQTGVESPPQVILIDSLHSFSIPRLVSMVRSKLLLEMPHIQNEAVIDQEVEECLKRVHFVFLTDFTNTIASLEAIRIKLRRMDLTVNIVLWDGFLSVFADKTSKIEVIRQLVRLWHGTTTLIIVASHQKTLMLDKYATCQISFWRKDSESLLYLANVSGKEFAVKVGKAGILS